MWKFSTGRNCENCKNNFMKINIKDLLEYFDLKETTDYGDTTATISVVGEDLGAAIFKHYCELERDSKVSIVDPNQHIPVQMKKIGRRLDRWIMEKRKSGNIFYQAEIKNWCSRAIGGVNVPLVVDEEMLNELAEKNWLHHISEIESNEGNGVNKVLVEMLNDKRVVNDKKLELPDSYRKEPLLILWNVAKPKEGKDFFFKYKLPERYFDYDYCWVFSCSLYLRHLYKRGQLEILIDMPNVTRRLNQLNQIFEVFGLKLTGK